MSDTSEFPVSSNLPRTAPPAAAASRAPTALPPTTLANVNLFVRDPERSRRFYVEALGLRDDARSAPPYFVLLDGSGGRAGGGCTLTLQAAGAMGEAPPDRAAVRAVELGFELPVEGADDAAAAEALDAAAARIAAAGGEVAPPQVMGWARGFDGRDPDGHRLTVFVRTAEGRPPGGPRPAR